MRERERDGGRKKEGKKEGRRKRERGRGEEMTGRREGGKEKREIMKRRRKKGE